MKDKMATVIATMVITAAVGAIGTTAWNIIKGGGVATVQQHNSDFGALAEHLEHAEEKLDRNYWTRLCDEWQEDLTDWLLVDEPTRQMLEDIRQKQEAISENDCYKYRE